MQVQVVGKVNPNADESTAPFRHPWYLRLTLTQLVPEERSKMIDLTLLPRYQKYRRDSHSHTSGIGILVTRASDIRHAIRAAWEPIHPGVPALP